MSRLTSYTWSDFSDGYLMYLNAERELNEELQTCNQMSGSLHMRDSERDNREPFNRESLRQAWTTFVSGLISPELAIHKLKFLTLTFADIRGAPPTLTHGRKQLEYFIADLAKLADSFVFVEERGKIKDRLHYHGLIRYDKMNYFPAEVAALLTRWRLVNGFFKYEDPKSEDKITAYTTKYLVKGAYSGDTGFWVLRSDAAIAIKMELK